MIKAIRKRARPDNLRNQVRTGGQSFARRLYLWSIVGLFVLLGWTFTGHWFFLDAEGIVTKERTIIAPDYAARVLSIHVKPGDTIKPGDVIATLQSREIIDSLAELSTRRAAVSSREAQVAGRIETIRKVLPDAVERRRKADETRAKMTALAARNLTTAPRLQDSQKEFYDAQREESSLGTELKALASERANVSASLADMDRAIGQVKDNYNGGRVIAQLEGTIGPKVPHVGQIVKSGDPMVEVYRGEMFVLAYMPIGRLYSVAPQDGVQVSDGQHTYPGRIDRIDNVTDALPGEFQVNFRATDRQQLFRIAFDGRPPFAIQSKIRLSGNWSPQGLMSKSKGAILAFAESIGGWMRSGATRTAAQ